jgi:RNA polymerase sigma-70 factor (ECF subfamily)
MTSAAVWTLARSRPEKWGGAIVRREVDAVADARIGELDDAALVELSLADRAGAFDLIVERHRQRVYQLCYRFVGNHEDASDLAQDVFVRAFRGLRGFRGHSSIGTWLYRIGINVCLNRVSSTRGSTSMDARNLRSTGF